MKFTVSTKPLMDSLNLGIVNSNVNPVYAKSTMAEISATATELTINLEATSICSEIRFKGMGDGVASIFVDCVLFKQLVATFETSTTTFEIDANSLTLHAGKSKFVLPRVDENSGFKLKRPAEKPAVTDVVDLAGWKFVKDYQMFAIAMSHLHKVYTWVWVGESGDVAVCDIDNGVFTWSNKGSLARTCLLKDTVINLFNALPEGAKIVSIGDSYLVIVETDGFEFVSEFLPGYEDDPKIGSYNHEIMLEMINGESTSSVTVNISALHKALNQASILSEGENDVLTLSVSKDFVSLHNHNLDCKLPTEEESAEEYSLMFKTKQLRSVITHCPEETISISPKREGDLVSGIALRCNGWAAALAGVDDSGI